MALLHCAECDGKVSENASVCPHCGTPKYRHWQHVSEKPKPRKRKKKKKGFAKFWEIVNPFAEEVWPVWILTLIAAIGIWIMNLSK